MRRTAATFLVCLLIWSRLDAQSGIAQPTAVHAEAPISLAPDLPSDAIRSVVLRDAQGPETPGSVRDRTEPKPDLVSGAVWGGAVGIGAGALAGAAVGGVTGGAYAPLAALAVGAVGAYAGASVGIPFGVARACRRSGGTECSTVGPVLVSLATGAAAAAFILAKPEDRMPYVAAVPLLQIGLSLALVR